MTNLTSHLLVKLHRQLKFPPFHLLEYSMINLVYLRACSYHPSNNSRIQLITGPSWTYVPIVLQLHDLPADLNVLLVLSVYYVHFPLCS